MENSDTYEPESDDQSDIEEQCDTEFSDDDPRETSRIRSKVVPTPAPKGKGTKKKQQHPKAQAKSTKEIVCIGDISVEWDTEKVICNDAYKHKPADNNYNNMDRFKFLQLMNQSVLAIFFLVYPIAFWTQVAKNTNDYAELKGVPIDWSPVQVWELLGFITLLMIHSIRGGPRIYDLWSKSDLYYCPLVTATGISELRYRQIRKFFHIAPIVVPEESKNDKYFKVRLMMEALQTNSKILHPFCENYSVDEMTIGYQGRTYLIKRTPSKKVSKAFQCVALSTDTGFVIDFHFDQDDLVISHLALSETGNRVMKVCKFLQSSNKYAHIFMDNRFSTPLLFYHLLKDFRLYATGTWRINYGVPNLIRIPEDKTVKGIEMAKSKGVQMCWTSVDGVKLIGISQYDNKAFYMLTSGMYELSPTISGTKKVSRLDVTHAYNAHMHGNDIADSLLVAFASYVRSPKYWYRLFHFLLDVGTNNVYLLFRILFALNNPTRKTSLEHSVFLVMLINEMITYIHEMAKDPVQLKKRKVETKSTSSQFPNRNKGSCFPKAVKSENRGRCAWCTIQGRDLKSAFKCEGCDLYLCIMPERNCFIDFHKWQ